MIKCLIHIMLMMILSGNAALGFECPKKYHGFKSAIEKLDREAEAQAKKDGSSKSLYQDGTLNELVTLIAPHELRLNGTLAGLAMQCWTHYYEFSESIMKKNSTKEEIRVRNEILSRWNSCFSKFYPGRSLGSEIVSCHKSLASE